MGFNNFFDIVQKIKPACKMIVTETVVEIAAAVQSNCPVLSGYMHDSVYYVTPDGTSTYGQASPTRPEDYLLPEVAPASDMQGVIGVGAYYAEFVEMGHHVHNSSTYVPPEPFFFPAFEQGSAIFENHMSELEALL